MQLFKDKKDILNLILLVIIVLFLFTIFFNFKDKKINYIMENTRYEVPIRYLNNKNKKAKVFIISGVHGNEIAGVKATEKILNEEYRFSKMAIISGANQEAYRLEVRNSYYMSDLNRAFPGKVDGTDTQKLAYEIFEVIKREKPDFVIDLHEWEEKFDENLNILSNGLIMNSIEDKLWKVCEKVYNDYNKLDKSDKLILNITPPIGSINKEVSERLGIPVITVESNMQNKLEDRIDFHIYIIENIIKNYEMDW